MRFYRVNDRAKRFSLVMDSALISWRRAVQGGMLFLALLGAARSEENVYSGPQPGERTTPFKSVEFWPARGATIIRSTAGRPMTTIISPPTSLEQVLRING